MTPSLVNFDISNYNWMFVTSSGIPQKVTLWFIYSID